MQRGIRGYPDVSESPDLGLWTLDFGLWTLDLDFGRKVPSSELSVLDIEGWVRDDALTMRTLRTVTPNGSGSGGHEQTVTEGQTRNRRRRQTAAWLSAVACCGLLWSGCATHKPIPAMYLGKAHSAELILQKIPAGPDMMDSGQGGLIGALITATSRANRMKEQLAGIDGAQVQGPFLDTFSRLMGEHLTLTDSPSELRVVVNIDTWGWYVPTIDFGIKVGQVRMPANRAGGCVRCAGEEGRVRLFAGGRAARKQAGTRERAPGGGQGGGGLCGCDRESADPFAGRARLSAEGGVPSPKSRVPLAFALWGSCI